MTIIANHLVPPAIDAQGNGVWNIWASLPGNRREVQISTGSWDIRSSIAHFLLDEGYSVLCD